MPKRRAVMIGCPQYCMLVRGTCECGEGGQYVRGPDGQFLLRHVRCEHRGGRCMQTLCALHRYNRRGVGSWYPTGIFAMPERRPSSRPARAGGNGHNDWYA